MYNIQQLVKLFFFLNDYIFALSTPCFRDFTYDWTMLQILPCPIPYAFKMFASCFITQT